MQNLTAVLEDILRTHLPDLDEQSPLPADVNLVEFGLDSLGAVNLVLDLEESLGIEFPDSLLTEATFATAASLEQVVGEVMDSRSVAAGRRGWA